MPSPVFSHHPKRRFFGLHGRFKPIIHEFWSPCTKFLGSFKETSLQLENHSGYIYAYHPAPGGVTHGEGPCKQETGTAM